MYDITVPADVDIMDSITEKPTGQTMKFVEFVRAALLADRRFSASQEALEQQQAIREAIRGKGPGDTVRILSNNDYSLLAEVAKLPQYGAGQDARQGYGTQAVFCLPFIDAVLTAKKVVKPAVEAVPDEDAKPKKKVAAVVDDD